MSKLRQFDTDDTVVSLQLGNNFPIPVRRARFSQLLDLRTELLRRKKWLDSFWCKLLGGANLSEYHQIEKDLEEIDSVLGTVEWSAIDLGE